MTPEQMVASIKRRVEKYRELDANGCWIWTASKTWAGYGRLQVTDETGRSTAWGAHRAAYVAWIGPVPEGMQLDHLCRVRECVNPRHLEPVTCAENGKRSPISPASINARRTHCTHGHAFDEENTYTYWHKGFQKRGCKTCRHDWIRRDRAKKQAAREADRKPQAPAA